MLSSARLFQQSLGQLDHNRLVTLINSLSDGFLATDGEGKIELSNSVALSLLDTNSLDGKNVREAMPLLGPQGDVQDILKLTEKAGGNLISRDLRLKYADGQIINIYLNASRVR
ncbi:MAG TPA: hypothetical protein VFK97_00175, partial [Candidatus Saccharimonadales bacterium]|nr:hypothetical protein [Candidatus Saccharimonadales bacterium]